MSSIFDRFWPILAIGKKTFVKKTLNNSTSLKQLVPKNFILGEFEEISFLALSRLSRYFGEGALNKPKSPI